MRTSFPGSGGTPGHRLDLPWAQKDTQCVSPLECLQQSLTCHHGHLKQTQTALGLGRHIATPAEGGGAWLTLRGHDLRAQLCDDALQARHVSALAGRVDMDLEHFDEVLTL